jgi:hypothetical protein
MTNQITLPPLPSIDGAEAKHIAGFIGYAVTSEGAVICCRGRGMAKGTFGAWREVKPRISKNGYAEVGLYENSKRITMLVHRLVLEAFIGPAPEGCEACHFPNKSRSDNRLSNLRWDTREHNQHDRVKHGTDIRGSDHGLAKLTESDVLAIRAEYVYHSREFGCPALARKYKVWPGVIWSILAGNTWGHVRQTAAKA